MLPSSTSTPPSFMYCVSTHASAGYADSPCLIMSIPLNSKAASTRSIFTCFRVRNIMKQVKPVQQIIVMRPTQFQPRSMNESFDRVIKIPSVLKIGKTSFVSYTSSI